MTHCIHVPPTHLLDTSLENDLALELLRRGQTLPALQLHQVLPRQALRKDGPEDLGHSGLLVGGAVVLYGDHNWVDGGREPIVLWRGWMKGGREGGRGIKCFSSKKELSQAHIDGMDDIPERYLGGESVTVIYHWLPHGETTHIQNYTTIT